MENRSVRWVGPVLSNALTHTVVHIFPSGGPVTAPYPCSTRLTLFGNGIERKSVVVDGARLSQPDGIDLKEAFPILQQGNGALCGIEVEVTTAQPRIDLQCSRCVFEFVNKDSSVRFWPAADFNREAPQAHGFFLEDGKSTTSLVVMNRGNAPIPHASIPVVPPTLVQLPSEVIPGAVAEIPVADRGALQRFESITEQVSASPFSIAPLPQDLFCFLMVRDTTTRRPISMVAL